MSISNIVLRRRGTGCLPQEADIRDWDFDRLGVGSSDLADEKTLRPYHLQRRNQRSASSCVGEGLSTAIGVAEAVAGLPHRPVSSLFPYWFGRYLDGMPLLDSGSRPRYALTAMRRVGIPDERHWPFLLRRVNKQPTPAALMEGHPRRDGNYVTIKDEGDARVLAMRASVDADHPLVFATLVTKAFTKDDGPIQFDRPRPDEPIAGGHMMCVIGYLYDEVYGWLFEVANSYGPGWRDDGCCWLTEDYIRWTKTRDISVVYGWKALQEAA